MNKKIKNEKFSIERQYKESWEFLKESKKYLVFSIALFILFGFIGFLFPVFMEKEILEMLKELALRFEGLGFLKTFSLIFINNAKTAFLACFLGFFVAIPTLTITVSNAYIIGFVARMATVEAGISVLWRLLPHGIFELPAIFISISLGLRLGREIFTKNASKNTKRNLIESLKVFVFITLPLLFIAAVVESFFVVFFG